MVIMSKTSGNHIRFGNKNGLIRVFKHGIF